MHYWPWWQVGLGLAATFVLSYWLQGRLLGVSGLLEALFEKSKRAQLPENLLFLACLTLGGALAAHLRGDWQLRGTLGPEFEKLFSAYPLAPLFLGGMLIGFGTRWAGGCTSGHGLNGCARLQPASLLSTACFFGTGVAVSLLLERLCS